MLIYEITATVNEDIAAQFETYMADRHIPAVIATGWFAAAFFAKNGPQYKIGYHADSQQALDSYLTNDAERLRADLKDHFPEGMDLTRQVLEIVRLFPNA